MILRLFEVCKVVDVVIIVMIISMILIGGLSGWRWKMKIRMIRLILFNKFSVILFFLVL